MATWDDVRRFALALPGTSEQTSRGKFTWAVSDKSFAWERPLRPADIGALGTRAPNGPILGVRPDDLEMKDVLLASGRDVFFTTPHFDGYPAVLIRLGEIYVLPRRSCKRAKTLRHALVVARKDRK